MLVEEAMPFYKLWVEIEKNYTSGDGYLDKLCMELIGLPSSRCRPPTRDVRERYRGEALEMMQATGVPRFSAAAPEWEPMNRRRTSSCWLTGDNVGVACATSLRAKLRALGGRRMTCRRGAIPLGHKIALRADRGRARRSSASACRSASPPPTSRRARWSTSTMSRASTSTMSRTTMSEAFAHRSVSPRRAGAMRGYPRADGRKGIRNYVLVAYLVECAHHVARHIAEPFQEQGAQLIGFPGCYPSAYAHRVMEAMCTHPNVGAVLLVSLGCEEFRRSALLDAIARERPAGRAAGHPGRGRHRARRSPPGRAWVEAQLAEAAAAADRADRASPTSSIGTKCGGSDGLSAASPPTRPSAAPSTCWSMPARR